MGESMFHPAQVQLIQDFRCPLQVNRARLGWCVFATWENFAEVRDYPKCLQSKQLWNNMLLIAGFGIGHALVLQHFATTHSTRETTK